jgi:hypothetical protein
LARRLVRRAAHLQQEQHRGQSPCFRELFFALAPAKRVLTYLKAAQFHRGQREDRRKEQARRGWERAGGAAERVRGHAPEEECKGCRESGRAAAE